MNAAGWTPDRVLDATKIGCDYWFQRDSVTGS